MSDFENEEKHGLTSSNFSASDYLRFLINTEIVFNAEIYLNTNGEQIKIEFSDSPNIVEFIFSWRQLYSLYEAGNMEKKLYETCLESIIQKYSKIAEIDLENSPYKEGEPHGDDSEKGQHL